MQSDKLYYDEQNTRFFIHSDNRNVAKAYAAERTRLANSEVGHFCYTIPAVYPDGITGVQDLKSIIGELKGTRAAKNQIEYLKAVPERIVDKEIISSIGYEFRCDPFLHQLMLIEYLFHYPRIAVLAEQGLGKTFIALNYLAAQQHRLGRKFRAIVLAPRIVLRNWIEETKTFTDLKAVLYRGSVDQRAEIRRQIREEDDWDIIVTNYEAVTPLESRQRERAPLKKAEITEGSVVTLDADKLAEVYEGEVPTPDNEAGTYKVLAIAEKEAKKKGKPRRFKLEGFPEGVMIPQPAIRKGYTQLVDDTSYLEDFRFFKEMAQKSDSLIMDEGSRLKGNQSKRSNAVKEIAEFVDNRIILSGTITLGNPLDVFMPFTILNRNIFVENYFRFKRHYCKFSETNKHMIVGYKNLNTLKRCIDPYLVTVTRDECLDMPDRIFDLRYVGLSQEQALLYNAIVSGSNITVQGTCVDTGDPIEVEVTVDLMVTKLNKIMQVLSGFIRETPPRDERICSECDYIVGCVESNIYPWNGACKYYHKLKEEGLRKPYARTVKLRTNPRLKLLKEDLQDIPESENIIIWTMYKQELRDVAGMLQDLGMPYIAASDKDCDSVYRDNKDIRIFLGQVSQGIGITLNKAALTIYYSRSLSLEDRLQSMDRNYRIGQTQKVIVRDYFSPETVDSKVLTLLRKKKDVRDFIQSSRMCMKCPHSMWCMERGIEIYSEKCIHFSERENAEHKEVLKLREVYVDDSEVTYWENQYKNERDF